MLPPPSCTQHVCQEEKCVACSPSQSRPASAGKPPRPTSAGVRPASGKARPGSAPLKPIQEDSYTSEDSIMSSRASPLFPEADTHSTVGGSPKRAASNAPLVTNAWLLSSDPKTNASCNPAAFSMVEEQGKIRRSKVQKSVCRHAVATVVTTLACQLLLLGHELSKILLVCSCRAS